jgi:hypothetical protein
MNRFHHLIVAASLGLTCANLPAGSFLWTGVHLSINNENKCIVYDRSDHALGVIAAPSQNVITFTDMKHQSPTERFKDWKEFSDKSQVDDQPVDVQSNFSSDNPKDKWQPTTVTITLPD